jgi:hypothetical protein
MPRKSDAAVELATRKAMAAIDELADDWAKSVRLDDMAATIAGAEKPESAIVALVKLAFVEGSYRAWCASRGKTE